ncbi:MAG: site-specific integrase [Sulfuricurvum sp.]|nr:site-specific integrase [Sulfuricurvum sp.]MDP3022716.1 site-specific integrase [Sulfuricurvum sp.]
MGQRLIKVNLKGYNCKGVYYEDSQGIFGCDEIDDRQPHSKIKPPFKIILRTTVQRKGKPVTSKKTFLFDEAGTTFKRAVERVSAQRETFRDEVATVGKIKPKEKAQTLREAWDGYITDREANNKLSAKNISNQKYIFDKHLKPLENELLNDVSSDDLQIIVNNMITSGSAPRTAKGIKDYLRPFFKAMKVVPNPAVDIELPSFDNAVKFELADDKAKKLMSAMMNYPEPTMRGIFSFLLDGRRLGEVLALQWSSIDFESHTYTVQGFTSKTRKTAQYTLRDDTKEALQNVPRESIYIFPARTDSTKPMSSGTFRNHWESVLDNLKIDMRIHDIRHLIGGVLVNSGATLEEIAAVLGHSSTNVTKRYSNVKKETASKAVNKFHEAMRQ